MNEEVISLTPAVQTLRRSEFREELVTSLSRFDISGMYNLVQQVSCKKLLH